MFIQYLNLRPFYFSYVYIKYGLLFRFNLCRIYQFHECFILFDCLTFYFSAFSRISNCQWFKKCVCIFCIITFSILHRHGIYDNINKTQKMKKLEIYFDIFLFKKLFRV